MFDVFTFHFIHGDPQTALVDPNGVVMTQSTAQRYFGNDDAIGKVINIDNMADLKVTGVIQDIPHNSHFHFDFLGSMKLPEQYFGDDEFQSWGSNNYATYLVFPQNYPTQQFTKEIENFIGRHHPQGEDAIGRTTLHLQRLTDIHLHSHLDSEIEANGNILYVYIFTAIAFFLLLIACINFMNLATARSANRAKEVGLRKVVGAERLSLVNQFLGESTFLAIISLVLALLIVSVALPQFNSFVGKELSLDVSNNLVAFLGLIGIALFVGIFAGSYPAFFLSNFQPVTVLKGAQEGRSPKSLLRRVLVVFQFAISIILIVSMGVVSAQLEYCQSKDLGLNKEHLVVLPSSSEMIERYSTFKHELLQHPNIVSVAGSKRIPSGRLLDSSGSRVITDEGEQPLEFRIANVRVDHDFIDTYGMEIVAGRNFSVDHPTDSIEAFILNETAVQKIGWDSPQAAIGKAFGYGGREGRIIGVVKDFHYESLHQPITPIVMIINPNNFNSISVRIRPDRPADIAATLDFLQGKWQEYRPQYPFMYDFVDERYNDLYQAEHKLGQIFGTFSLLAIFIACLGLFGLAAFAAEQRTKEIGIRKVLGATVSNVAMMLSKEFTLLVLFSTALAWPVAYFSMNIWLEEFAYRININQELLTFIAAAVIAFLIALATVSFQAIKAALTNPVDSLRYE